MLSAARFIRAVADRLSLRIGSKLGGGGYSSGSHVEKSTKKLARVVAAGCLLQVSAGMARAQTGLPVSTVTLKRMSVEELLEQEVVSVSRRREPWRYAASSIFLIRGEGAQIAGASTLPQLLRLAPNLFVAQSSSSHWAVNARGFVNANGYSNKLLVLIDGRPVYSPLFSNVFWDSQDVFVPDVDRVEVISGPSGAAWGSNAVNGVINVLSKTAHQTQGGMFYAETGTEQKSHLGVRFGGRFGATGAFRIYAKRAEYDGTLDAAGVDDGFDPWNFSKVGFRADWGVSQQSEWTLQGDAFRGRYDNGASSQTSSDGANLSLRWARHVSAASHLTARIYHDYTKRDMRGMLDQTSRSTDFEIQHRLTFSQNQELLWGGNYRLMRDRIRDTVGFVILPADLSFDLSGLFFQHQINFGALRVITGYRAEHNYFSGWEHQPSLRLAWNLSPNHTTWVSAARTTRTPSRLDTGIYLPAEPPYTVAGGPGFMSEKLQAYELGWRAKLSANASLSTTAFFHDYDDLRSLEPTTPITTGNGVEGRSYGVEIFFDLDVKEWWRVRTGYFHVKQETWLSAGSGDADRGQAESSFPSQQLQLRNTFRLSSKVSLWTNLRHVAAVPTFSDARDEVPAYTELDARLSWNISPDIELAIAGRNLLDRSHPEIGSVATRREIQRSAEVSMRCAF
jgi:iron complex outermembrane recepter protein